ncbi:MAG TPA: NrsF family protein [Gammaproteobacteria bacterium]|nr:NrsF family protein [Gammaproteobacteria bacterium]
MNTNDLIQRLSQDLVPIEPLRRPGSRAFAWLAAAAVYVAALTGLLAQGGVPIELSSPRVWLPNLAAVVASLLASWAAFASVIPGHSRRAAVCAAIGGLVWVASAVAASQWHSDVATIVASRHEVACVGVIVLGGAPMLVAMAVMLRRGAAFTPGTTAAFAAFAVGVLANIGACFWRPHAVDDVTLVWHGGAILALVLASALGARLVSNAVGGPFGRVS